ncbi:MAG: ABC transporter ATP-binding protein [Erysipelotrichaceae bacterium]
MKPILEVNNIEKYYGKKGIVTKAIDRMSFTVNQGEFLGIMGPSGSGKTTLLNCISTIDEVSTGSIVLDGIELRSTKGTAMDRFRKDKLGFIFQDFNLLDTLTAYENIALALSLQGVDAEELKSRVLAIAKHLEIEDTLSRYPYQLSGGQQQRVACARALVKKPALVLADEPTGALDSKSARLLLERLETLHETLDSTIVMVTHDAFSASYAHRILFIKDGAIFCELVRGSDSRKDFFHKIMEVTTLLGGDDRHVF